MDPIEGHEDFDAADQHCDEDGARFPSCLDDRQEQHCGGEDKHCDFSSLGEYKLADPFFIVAVLALYRSQSRWQQA